LVAAQYRHTAFPSRAREQAVTGVQEFGAAD